MPGSSDRRRAQPVQSRGASGTRATRKPGASARSKPGNGGLAGAKVARKAPAGNARSGKNVAGGTRSGKKAAGGKRSAGNAAGSKAPRKKAAATRAGKAAAATRPLRPYAVRRSAIHGRGVFATRTIRKGTDIIEYRGERISMKEADRRPGSDPDNPYHTFLFELDDGRVIDAAVRGNAARWINHSCAPNCEPYENDEGRVFIEAKRTIRKGEELSYDYRLNVPGRITRSVQEAYACRCGAPRCRGTMLGRKPR